MNFLSSITAAWIVAITMSSALVLGINVGVGHYVFDFLQLAFLR